MPPQDKLQGGGGGKGHVSTAKSKSNHNLAAAASSLEDDITYADLDHRAFMVPANQVLPPLNTQAYAEISVSRSKLV